MPSSYLRWRLLVPTSHEEVLAADLWARGCLGIEVLPGDRPEILRFEVYFPDPLPEQALGFDLEEWQRRGVERSLAGSLTDDDWLAGYRAQVRTLDVGDGFLVDVSLPGEPSPPPEVSGRRTLRIPAQTAFGTGSHESTRLVVRFLERLEISGLAVLDVGTGSGILSFVAEILGAQRVVGLDRDASAVCIASSNARLNGLEPRLFAGQLLALRARPLFDLALVNVIPENIAAELPALTRLLRPGGRIISSGNLLARRDELLAGFAAVGLSLQDELHDDEWVAFPLVTKLGRGEH